MRILHTSDWHLGRSFGDHRLLDEQAAFVDWLVDVVRHESIDLVVVAGDLFDRSVPPADAVELLHDAFGRLLDCGAEVAAITGNHDSAERIGSLAGLVVGGLTLRGGYPQGPAVDVRHFADGPLALVPVPYLDPAFAPADDDAGRPTHEAVLRRTLTAARATLSPGVRSLAIAHAFVTGAEPSESERTLAVGDAAMVSAAIFDRFDYVALGHLHRAQTVGGDERVRYSGAPLAYSFGETAQKEVVLIELDPDGDARTKPVPVDVGRRVCTVTGSLDELLAGEPIRNDWVRVQLTDQHPVADAHRRLRDRYPHMVEIERIAVAPTDDAVLTAHQAHTRSPADLADEFLQMVGDATEAADRRLVHEALAEAEQPEP